MRQQWQQGGADILIFLAIISALGLAVFVVGIVTMLWGLI